MEAVQPYTRRVFFYETDKMQIMHHSNYIRIFEESRVDFLRQIGLPFGVIEDAGYMMPVLSVNCVYKSPLRFDESFAVYPTVTFFNGIRLEMAYKVISVETGRLCVEGTSSHCFTDENLKPVSVKRKNPEIYEAFKSHAAD
ncbi:MAG: acyl-CoA thioesterase [Oscillospiraceae bacterium]|nr:acyl-CoA thioesterase [Oscillospiraceae bacterium]